MKENREEIEAAVVFVDLVRFTAPTDVHGDRVGADAAVAIETAARQRSEHGVELVKALGDDVLLRATDPAEGLRVAGAIIEDVQDLGLDARAGVHHGSVVVHKGDIFGSTVNLASRLAAIAPAGTMMVTRPVALALDGTTFVVSPRGPTAVKGLHDPVETFRVDPCRHDGA